MFSAEQTSKLVFCCLAYGGSARHWGFGLYLASSGRYENQILPSGFPSGSPEEALDCGPPSRRGTQPS